MTSSFKDLNRQLLNQMKHNDFQGMKMTYLQMAYEEAQSNKPFLKLLQEAHKSELQRYQQTGLITKVKILTAGKGNACSHCYELEGKIYDIGTALMEMPIPHPDCQFHIRKDADQGWCRCSYIAVLGK